jgi:hypothetical protein
MKKKQLILSLLFIAIGSIANAQVEFKPKAPTPAATEQTDTEAKPAKKVKTEPPKLNVLKINLLSPIVSSLMLFYEHSLNKESSLQLGMGYMDFYGFGSSNRDSYSSSSLTSKTNFNENTKGFFITPEYRYLISGEHMNGLFIAPFMKYTYMHYHEDYELQGSLPKTTHNDNYYYHSLGIGITIGQQIIYKNRVSIEIFGGPVYNMLLNSSGNGGNDNKPTISESFSNQIIRGYGCRAGLTVGFLF